MRSIFSKMTTERKPAYAIVTCIQEMADGGRRVCKRALSSQAVPHIRKIEENARILCRCYGQAHVADCERAGEDALIFPYIEGSSLLTHLQQAVASEDRRSFCDWMDFYEREILRGEAETTADRVAVNPAGRDENIDLTFDNIIVTEDGWQVIDYEWLSSGLSRDFLRVRALSRFLVCAGEKREVLLGWLAEIYPDLQQQLSSREFQMLEQSFLDEVLLFPHDGYKRTIYSLEDLLERARQEIRRERDEGYKKRDEMIAYREKVIRTRDEELRTRDEELRTKNAVCQAREQELKAIRDSRGYRLLLRYYRLRDALLPRGSVRRLLLKNAVWAGLHPRQVVALATFENWRKLVAAWRLGGIRQVVSRVDGKLHSASVVALRPGEDVDCAAHLRWLAAPMAPALPAGTVIDIVVPVYNALDFTQRCLTCVFRHTDVDYRLIVIDDCSPEAAVGTYMDELRRRKPSGHLQEIIALTNDRNLGFLGTVNRAFSLVRNPVVLLNTDVEVPPGWLSRLVAPLFAGEKIATVTPFSNSAEICSFPRFVQNNDLPAGLDVAAVDALFRRYGDPVYVEVPTGIGFAMAIHYDCLREIGGFDPVFDKGYGEENDFCRRAVASGWKNVQVRNLFVYHKHGASFATRKDASRAERLAKNLAILNKKHQGYDRLIQEYIAKDPCRAQRIFLMAVVRAAQGSRRGTHGVMFFCHSLGGGTQTYQDMQIKKRCPEERVYSAALLADGQTLLVREHRGEDALRGKEIARFDYRAMTESEYDRLLESLHIDEVYINHLLGFRLPDFLLWNERCGVPYTMFLHDFFCACPRYNLLNDKKVYCRNEKDLQVCEACLRHGVPAAARDIRAWREMMGQFLSQAAIVRAPSRDTAEIFRGYYPQVAVEVREHELSATLHKTYEAEFALDSLKTIAVLGAIGYEKGAEVVEALRDHIEREDVPVRLVVIGYTNRQSGPYRSPSGKFEVTGTYDALQVSSILASYRVSLVLIPSIWPETFSYTTSEAIASGYPVLAFDVGAPAERIKRMKAGETVPLESGADGMWREIRKVLHF